MTAHPKRADKHQLSAWKVEEKTTAHLLVLSGSVKLDCVRALHQEVTKLAHRGKDVILDWSNADHIDACVLQVFIALGTTLGRCGRRLRVRGANPAISKYLTLAGLEAFFPPLP